MNYKEYIKIALVFFCLFLIPVAAMTCGTVILLAELIANEVFLVLALFAFAILISPLAGWWAQYLAKKYMN